ncbi:TrmH family RNA methyltransferase [Leeuwenhoekiella sp. MAR_2009_132]|uniref:TrmH family RNA methyltransferase n=1 Tax=Leeuwenhoekiella sp. MAR_2009_132 TaxID=1392489 RepID=UPI00048B38D7|nr:RNA methyltransferase [Leeuwenhoekiella sp. MAR_2009_132]
MVSKSQIKLITSLNQKKYRQQHGLFVVEGIKGIEEFLNSHFKLHSLFTTEGFFDGQANKELISENELKKISFLKTPQKALAIFEIPQAIKTEIKGLQLVVDDLRDPGNLGTLIRLCDWFNIENLVCSNQTVDCYNPKVVQATMGSITRVNVVYTNLAEYLKAVNLPVYGAFMNGVSVYEADLPEEAILILGNEANGISTEIADCVTQKISIPQFGTSTTESLNVAIAGAILVSEFKRR